MTEEAARPGDRDDRSVKEQLERAVRDLWSMIEESGEDYIVFLDRRRLKASVRREPDGSYAVSWEDGDQSGSVNARRFENLREAAFHAYQGPH